MTVVCEFDDIQDLSCVLVGREYGDKTLLLVENIINTIDVPIDKNGTYTFSIFVMDGQNISEEPVVTERIEIPTGMLHHYFYEFHGFVSTVSDEEKDSSTLLTVLVIVPVVVILCVLIILTGIVTLCLVKKKQHRKVLL